MMHGRGVITDICIVCGEVGDGSDEFNGPDPCLGRIDGIKFACCGHHDRSDAHFVLDYNGNEYSVIGVRAFNMLTDAKEYGIEVIYHQLTDDDIWIR